jgi:acetyl esterase/lipase
VSDRSVRTLTDVVYTSPVGFRPLALDLYVPAGATTLCLYLHGGGWRVGSRRDPPAGARGWSPSFFEQLAQLGLAVASIDYRLSGEATFPAQSEDVSAAADFLAATADRHGLAVTRTVAWGVSAGGHLAALHALDPANGISAAACWYTPLDLESLPGDIDDAGGRGDRGPGSREAQLLGASVDEDPRRHATASPLRHVSAGAPPFLLVHGRADVAVPLRQSERMADALHGAGVAARLDVIDGASHMWPEVATVDLRGLVEETAHFLLEV